MISLPFAARSLAGRVRQVLDGLMIAASLLLVSWVLERLLRDQLAATKTAAATE